jgi:hypothetical protein
MFNGQSSIIKRQTPVNNQFSIINDQILIVCHPELDSGSRNRLNSDGMLK